MSRTSGWTSLLTSQRLHETDIATLSRCTVANVYQRGSAVTRDTLRTTNKRFCTRSFCVHPPVTQLFLSATIAFSGPRLQRLLFHFPTHISHDGCSWLPRVMCNAGPQVETHHCFSGNLTWWVWPPVYLIGVIHNMLRNLVVA